LREFVLEHLKNNSVKSHVESIPTFQGFGQITFKRMHNEIKLVIYEQFFQFFSPEILGSEFPQRRDFVEIADRIASVNFELILRPGLD